MRSNKAYDWLGSGIYLWESDPLRAYEWAQQRHPDAPSLVGAALELGLCLDLTTRTGAEAVKQAFRSYEDLRRANGTALSRDKSVLREGEESLLLRYLDKDVIEHLHDSIHMLAEEQPGVIREFDTVRALFPEGKPLYDGAGFLENTHIQIAVRNPRQIRGVFRVPSIELDELGIAGVYD